MTYVQHPPNAFPAPPPFTFPPYPSRTPLPIYPPPEPLSKPTLPATIPRDTPEWLKEKGFELSTHLIPACHLRSTRPVPEPSLPPADMPRKERMAKIVGLQKELDALRTEVVTDGYPRVLWNVLNRYVKTSRRSGYTKDGATLFFAHANGFPKEIWEPVLRKILASTAGDVIDEVWCWESVQHGDAGLINAHQASALFDWIDNGRDISNFLLHYIPSASHGPSSSATTLPTYLPRIPTNETEARIKRGLPNRNFIGVGHSYGGCTTTLAAILYPTLFHSILLIDPVIVVPQFGGFEHGPNQLALGALARRDTWSSKEEALESFLKNPFFQAWDIEVLKVYVEHGLYSSSSTQVKLKTTPMQEAAVFNDKHTAAEVFTLLATPESTLPLDIHIRWIMPGKPGTPDLGPQGTRGIKVWARRENVSNSACPGGGHLIPQEAPKDLVRFHGSVVGVIRLMMASLVADDISGYLVRVFAPTQDSTGVPRRANL